MTQKHMVELEKTHQAKEFRRRQASELVMPCPRCFSSMEYRQESDFEGWFCVSCGKGTPIGNNDEFKKQEKCEGNVAIPSKEELIKKASKFRKK